MSFNENLKYYMECKGIQTKELADKTGLSTNTISSYLKTKGSLPDAEKAVKIAEVLGITVEKLVKGVTSSIKNISTLKELKPEILSIEESLIHFSNKDLHIIESLIESLNEKY